MRLDDSLKIRYEFWRYIEGGSFEEETEEGQRIKHPKFDASQRDQVVSKYKEQMETFKRDSEAKVLETALNNAINKNKENYLMVIKKIMKELDNQVYERLKELGKNIRNNNEDAFIFQKEGSVRLNQENIKNSAKKYMEKFKEIASTLRTSNSSKKEQKKERSEIEQIIDKLNGGLNKFRGDIFENFLALILDDIEINSLNLIEQTVEDLEGKISKSIEKLKSQNISLSWQGYQGKNAKVSGGSIVKKMGLSVDGKEVAFTGSQGKTDIAISGLDGDFSNNSALGISAKSYLESGRISLLSGGNIGSLISEWPVSGDLKNLAINGLSAKTIATSQFNLMKKIFLIQALAGTSQDELKSQFLIINRNNINNPFLVFSVYDLLFKYSFSGNFGNKNDKITFSKLLNYPRTKDSFYNFIVNAIVSVHTELTIAQMAKEYHK